MKIAPGIHNVIRETTPDSGITNTYMVIGSEGAVFIDTGWPQPEENKVRLDYIDYVGNPPIKGLISTHMHPPHWGGSPAIKKATGAPIICAPAEKEILETRMGDTKVDKVVLDGELMSLGDITLQFVHAPGHTYGSLAVYIEESGALFTGDNVMGIGTSVINPGEGEIGLFLETMEKFIKYKPTVIYPGQGPVVTNPRAKLLELIRHRHAREQQILELLQESSRSVNDLLESMYTGLNQRLQQLAGNQIQSHLIKLERDGKVTGFSGLYKLNQNSDQQ